MTVRLKIALTIFVTGLLTALGVIATVLLAFQRFEHETTYHRANALPRARGAAHYDDLFDMHERQPDEFAGFLRNLVLFEPDSQLYLLDAQGTVLATTGRRQLPPGFKVALAPVLRGRAGERADALRDGRRPRAHGRQRRDRGARAAPRRDPPRRAGGRLPVPGVPQAGAARGRGEALRSSFARPALALILARGRADHAAGGLDHRHRDAPAAAADRRRGARSRARASDAGLPGTPSGAVAAGRAARRVRPARQRLSRACWTRCASSGTALRRLDHFRREGVSNLSHDLRSPLTATAACLETLDVRWAATPARADDRALVEVALRNTRNAARLVQSLGDLAQLDEPEFKLQPETVDAAELLDDIALRFADARRAAGRGAGAASTATRRRRRWPRSTSSCSSARSPTCSTTR